MKNTNYMKVLLLSGFTLGSAWLQAHTHLETALPADGAVLREAPTTLELGFSTEVQLLKLDIATATGTAQDMDFTPVANAAKTFSIPLPAMGPDAYVVSWTILGADGHRVEGNLEFLVDAVAHEPADAESEDAAQIEDAAESAAN